MSALVRVAAVALGLLASGAQCADDVLGSTVAGIDFGAGFVKAAYVAPGEGELLPVALNDMSERKTANVVAFRGDGSVRVGPHAVKPLANAARRGYAWLQPVLGVPWDAPAVQDETLPFREGGLLRDAESGGVAAEVSDDAVRPVAHLVGVLLGRVGGYVEADARRRIRDAVLTVPPHWGAAQRSALLDAAAIAGLSVAGLVSDVGAAALYYGAVAAPRDAGAHTVVLFDSGATHSAAAVVRIDPAHKEGSGAPQLLVEVVRVASDTVLCGRAVDRAMAGVLARRFAKAHKMDESLPMAALVPPGKELNRLLAEAARVKEILSANTEIRAAVEELVGARALPATVVSRAELEDACAHLRGRAGALVAEAVAAAGIKPEDVAAVIPVGGNSRVPFVAADLRAALGDGRVHTRLNMDEAAAQGAALHAAVLAGFRVRPLRFVDHYPRSVSLRYALLPGSETGNGAEAGAENADPNIGGADSAAPDSDNPKADSAVPASETTVEVYPHGGAVGAHRALTFRGTDAVRGTVLEDGAPLLALRIASGAQTVAAWLAAAPGRTLVSARTKVWIDIARRPAAPAVPGPPAVLVEYREAGAQETLSATLPLDDWAAEPAFLRVPPATVSRLAAAVRAERDAERAAAQRAALTNALEETVYRLRDRTDDGDGPNGFREFLSAPLRERVLAALAAASDAVDTDNGSPEHEALLRAALHDVTALEEDVAARRAEHDSRPGLASSLRARVAAVLAWAEQTLAVPQDARAQNDEEIDALVAAANSLRAWMDDAEAQQARLSLADDPAVACADIRRRTEDLLVRFSELSVRRLPDPEPLPAETPIDASIGTPIDAPTESPVDAPTESPADAPPSSAPTMDAEAPEPAPEHDEL